MDPVLVDTNVVSFIFKQDTRQELYQPHLEGRRVCVSFMTVAELYRWTIMHKWGKRRVGELEQELSRYLVLPFDDALAWAWARVRSIRGHPVEPSDAWIAAAAVRYDMPLVTHNPSDFQAIPNLQIISEA